MLPCVLIACVCVSSVYDLGIARDLIRLCRGKKEQCQLLNWSFVPLTCLVAHELCRFVWCDVRVWLSAIVLSHEHFQIIITCILALTTFIKQIGSSSFIKFHQVSSSFHQVSSSFIKFNNCINNWFEEVNWIIVSYVLINTWFILNE